MVSTLRVSLKKITVKEKDYERMILKNIFFNLETNSVFALIGKNGSGKSILAKSLTSLLDPNQFNIDGRVIYENQDLLKISREELLTIRRSKIRYVFQDSINSFDPLRRLEYYFKNTNASRECIDELLEYFLLPASKKIYRYYPHEVSGGMSQRISLIIALLSEPEILILDEPTSAVDYPIANLFLLKLKEFVSKKTNSVFLITQDNLFATKLADGIAILSDGSLTIYNPEVCQL